MKYLLFSLACLVLTDVLNADNRFRPKTYYCEYLEVNYLIDSKDSTTVLAEYILAYDFRENDEGVLELALVDWCKTDRCYEFSTNNGLPSVWVGSSKKNKWLVQAKSFNITTSYNNPTRNMVYRRILP